jgi:hypothetical protein
MIVSPLLLAAESPTMMVYDPVESWVGVATLMDAKAGVKSFAAPRSKARISPATSVKVGRFE